MSPAVLLMKVTNPAGTLMLVSPLLQLIPK
jgi:hypothetical protein